MEDLDKLYSPRLWSKRFKSSEEVVSYHLQFIGEASGRIRKQISCELNVAYGTSPRQRLDIFGTDLDDEAPIFIFVHGGYWQIDAIGRESYHFIAENLHANKIKSIFVGYDLCPTVTLPEIVQQMAKALQKCLNYAKNNKSKGVYLMGHSAGAHLVASLFQKIVPDIVKGVVLASGVFDLVPVQKTHVNQPLKLDEKLAVEVSPLRQKLHNEGGAKFWVIVGANESPAFRQQSQLFHRKLQDCGSAASFQIVPEVDHFDLIEKLQEGDYSLTKLIIDLINNEK